MPSVRDSLSRSPIARAAATLDLGRGRGVTIWENHDDRVTYDTARGHVFSLYLKGGTGTRRVDGTAVSGWPGAVCIFPDGQTSEWEITTPFRFVHLYLPDDRLRADFARTHECDARRMDLPEVTFAEMPALGAPLGVLAGAASSGDILLADAAIAELVGRLASRPVALRGGLAPHVLRRLDEWIDAHLDETISLSDLAVLADLSPFHLHRMFRVSRGMALHAWITERRIDRSKALLGGPDPLIEVALACGFASQSHFTRAFKAATNATPTTWRRARRDE
ncbi:AraC family transcriptional regulator [Salipiger sp. IMCC34102]|uniref:helix-turn-helix transcriptional regulator n=1 Tax=Salipiger sp. IMCC34102 TaxID=2510647 RepID=UPI00101C7DF9|nr:AraC family transcriptional regulator [Salipiger sp. IMCC34102]RYH00824.1 AraC family transcriptional regulator [Salipiger sp. IMCC34102]